MVKLDPARPIGMFFLLFRTYVFMSLFSITGAENQPGLLPLFAHNLFHKISKDALEKSVYVSLSFYEIYQEKVMNVFLSTNFIPLFLDIRLVVPCPQTFAHSWRC